MAMRSIGAKGRAVGWKAEFLGVSIGMGLAVVSAGAGATAAAPVDAYLPLSSHFKASGGGPGESNIEESLYGQAGSYGKGTSIANLSGRTSFGAGPVAYASVTTSGWTEAVPAYNGLYMLGEMESDLGYTFEIIGPAAVSVPLVIDGRMAGGYTGPPTAGSYARVNAWVTDDYPYNSHIVSKDSTSTFCISTGDPADCNKAFKLHLNIVSSTATQVGQIGTIDLYAEADFYGTYFGAASSYAYADPVVSIDPAFLAANPGYSLVFSQGVVNALAPVPEPASGVLLLAGLGALGVLKRRKAGPRRAD